jgi:hypothetical protein
MTMALGCALGDRSITLRYEPALDPSIKGSGRVAIVRFDDLRTDKVTVGEIHNNLGMKTANVVIKDQDAGAWVANALAAELQRAGVAVVPCAEVAAAKEQIVITGCLAELYTTSGLSHQCRIRCKVVVTKAGTQVLNKEYTSEASSVMWVGNIGEFEAIDRETLQKLMKSAVPEVLNAIK